MSREGNGPSPPPVAFARFVERFPHLGRAWDQMREEEESGPLDGRTRRLVKLGVAIGMQAEGATHSATRKARAAGCSLQEMEQVVALAASLIGLPASVKVHRWVEEVKEGEDGA